MNNPVLRIVPIGSGYFLGKINGVTVSGVRPNGLPKKLTRATGCLRPVYHRHGTPYTDGTVMETWCDEPLMPTIDGKPGAEWVPVDREAGFVSVTATPRLLASGVSAVWNQCKPEFVWIHRDDTFNGSLIDCGYNYPPKVVGVSIARVKVLSQMIQSGKIAPKICLTRHDASRWLVHPLQGLTASEWAALGRFSMVPEGVTQFEVASETGVAGPVCGVVVPPSISECRAKGIEATGADCVVLNSGEVVAKSFVIAAPLIAARELKQPWLAVFRKGTAARPDQWSMLDLGEVGVKTSDLAAGLVSYTGDCFKFNLRATSPEVLLVLKQTKLDGVPYIEADLKLAVSQRRGFVVASVADLDAHFLPLAVASRKVEVPASGIVSVAVAGEQKLRDANYVIAAEVAAWPARGVSMKEGNARAKVVREQALERFGHLPDVFNPRMHSVEQLAAHIDICERLKAGKLFTQAQVLADVSGTPLAKIFSDELEAGDRHLSIKDPLSGVIYYEATIVLADELRRRPRQLIDAISKGMSGVVSLLLQDEEAIKQFHVSLIVGD